VVADWSDAKGGSIRLAIGEKVELLKGCKYTSSISVGE